MFSTTLPLDHLLRHKDGEDSTNNGGNGIGSTEPHVAGETTSGQQELTKLVFFFFAKLVLVLWN